MRLRVLAIDHGRARTGLAVSDQTGTIARPLPPITRVETKPGRAELDRVIREIAPDVIVVGEPRHLSGAAGEQARVAAGFAARLRSRHDIPVQLVDERLTTVDATRRAGASGSVTSVDSLAACVLLESYLERR